MSKTYKETREAVKRLILEKGLGNILNRDLAQLYDLGHNVTNVQNAVSYFKYSPQTRKYREA